MRVLKFGGTSVASGALIARVAELVAVARAEERCVVVVSALAGVTDTLVSAVQRTSAGEDGREAVAVLRARHLECLIGLAPHAAGPAEAAIEARLAELSRWLARTARGRRCPRPKHDRILAAGERLSVLLLAAALRTREVPPEVVDGTEVIATEASLGEAVVDVCRTARMAASRLAKVRADAVPVVTGFIGADRYGRTATLGRGGSDYSASLLGAALGASRVEIWTDVDGVLSAPPRLVPDAVTVPHLGYREAGELALLGGKVLHPKTMQPLAERGIPIVVRNTFAPDVPGTLIHTNGHGRDGAVRVVTAIEEAVLLTIEQPRADGESNAVASLPVEPLFRVRAGGALAFAFSRSEADAAENALARGMKTRGTVRRRAIGVVAAVGERCAGFAAGLFHAVLASSSADAVVAPRASSRALCAAVERSEVKRLTRLLHADLVRGDGRSSHARPRPANLDAPRWPPPSPEVP